MSTTFRRLLFLAAMAAPLTALVACFGDDPTEPPSVIIEVVNLDVETNAQTIGALVGETFTFDDGGFFDDRLSGDDLSVTFTSADEAQFDVGDTENFTADITFGSCIFTITSSTYEVGEGPQVGDEVEIVPCNYNINTENLRAGQQGSGQALLKWGDRESNSVNVTITISEPDENGNVTISINGTDVKTGDPDDPDAFSGSGGVGG